jgi:hypothetical protein
VVKNRSNGPTCSRPPRPFVYDVTVSNQSRPQFTSSVEQGLVDSVAVGAQLGRQRVQGVPVHDDRHKYAPLMVGQLHFDRPAQRGGHITPFGAPGRVEAEPDGPPVPVLALQYRGGPLPEVTADLGRHLEDGELACPGGAPAPSSELPPLAATATTASPAACWARSSNSGPATGNWSRRRRTSLRATRRSWRRATVWSRRRPVLARPPTHAVDAGSSTKGAGTAGPVGRPDTTSATQKNIGAPSHRLTWVHARRTLPSPNRSVREDVQRRSFGAVSAKARTARELADGLSVSASCTWDHDPR